MVLNKFVISFDFLLCVDQHLMLVGGWQVDAGLGCAPVSEAVDGEGHLARGQFGGAAQVGHFAAFLVDRLSLKQIAVARPLVEIHLGLVEAAPVLAAEVAEQQVQVAVL